MLGLLINETEQKELEYMIKRELEELLFDLEDDHIDEIVKEAMEKRYHKLFKLLLRVASKEACLNYMPAKNMTR